MPIVQKFSAYTMKVHIQECVCSEHNQNDNKMYSILCQSVKLQYDMLPVNCKHKHAFLDLEG